MIYLTAAYSILSALSVVIALIGKRFVSAFCLALLAAFAIGGGRELKALFTNKGKHLDKIGRAILAILLIAVSLYFARQYRVDIFVYAVRGIVWSVIGIAIGYISTPAGKGR